MSSLSIRKLPHDLERELVREARKRGSTKSEIVIEALKMRFGLGDRALLRKRLRGFFGKMSRADLKEFDEATKGFSKIDPELWS